MRDRERQIERCGVRDGHTETETERTRDFLCTDAHEGRESVLSPHCAPLWLLCPERTQLWLWPFLHFLGPAGLFIDFRMANDHVGWKKLLWPD